MSDAAYRAPIEFEPDDGLFVGHVAGIDDVVGFDSETVFELTAFREAVDDYVTTCRAVGEELEKASSGKLMLQIAPEIHAEAARAAQRAGISLNSWAEDAPRRSGSAVTASLCGDA